MKNLILSMCMVALSTMGFGQYQLVNDTIFTDVPVAVVKPNEGEVITFYKVSESVISKMEVLVKSQYPRINFNYYYISQDKDVNELSVNKKGESFDKKRPLKSAGKNLAEGATILAVSPIAGGLLVYAVNPLLGGLVTVGGYIVGYVKLIRAGEELEYYEER